MKKVLILSHLYLPNQKTSSFRIHAWAKFFHLHGLYPEIVTTNWLNNNDIQIEKNQNNTVHYVKQQKVENKVDDSLFSKVKRDITNASRLVFESDIRKSQYKHLFNYCKELLQNKKFDFLLISGSPFLTFHAGYLLNKTFDIKWAADYRDLWTLSEFKLNKYKIVDFIYKKRFRTKEIEWLNRTEFISISTSFLKKKLQTIHKKKSIYIIENGFFNEDKNGYTSNITDHIVFLYSGRLYDVQDPIPFITLLTKLKINKKIIIRFLGSHVSSVRKQKINSIIENHRFIEIEFIPPVTRAQALQEEKDADILITFRYGDKKGIPASKLYNYIALFKPIICFPSDHDIIEKMINETERNLNVNGNLEKALSQYIQDEDYREEVLSKINNTKIDHYSREYQTEKLSKLITQCI